MGKNKKQNMPNNGHANNVVALTKCMAEECNKKDKKAGFCEEHYAWFKEGLLNKKGEKAKDFERKWQHYIARAS